MKMEDFMLPCPIKKTFGIECLGCGSQRAIVMVFQGRFTEAFHLYPAVYTLLLFFFILGISFIDRKRKYGNLLVILIMINIVVMIVSYVCKHAVH
ncbi:DUF2752 domain-containing protein [Chryseobacterium fluminis]|uniref:DUF2752 domain-containing protein n=1 Tax=Chryseobacterium fluminis TaxID=2983606 RepID=UPI0022539E7C|nr:DUF2752 domain-containing protein [Chryseobacterium sp. MMS21-Ot14]UZT99565.1 DUF2752 domain-containing protein [Chryseobacterium sp. MMS21-Ot14]